MIVFIKSCVDLDMYKKSVEDPEGFWSEIASQFCWKDKRNPEVHAENIDMK